MSMFETLPPADVECERHVLASCMVDESAIYECALKLEPGHFSREEYRWAWAAITSLWNRGEPVNQVTVAYELSQQEYLPGVSKLEELGGSHVLVDMISQLPTSVGAGWYADNVRRTAELSALVRCAAALTRAAYAPNASPTEIRDVFSAKLLGISDGKREGFALLGDVGRDVLDDVEAWMDAPRELQGPATGFARLDQTIGGLAPGRVSVLVSDTGAGKTAFMQDMLRRLARDGVPSLAFSTEMSRGEWYRRILMQQAALDPVAVRKRGRILPEERDAVRQGFGVLEEMPIAIVDSGRIHVANIVAQARRHKALHGTQVIVVDYLQRIRGEGRTRTEEYEDMARVLKELAKDLDVHVCEVSQSNREGRRDGPGNVGRNSIKGSGEFEDNADAVLVMRPVELAPEGDWVPIAKERVSQILLEKEEVTVEIKVEKNRHGPEGSFRTVLSWKTGGRYYEVRE